MYKYASNFKLSVLHYNMLTYIHYRHAKAWSIHTQLFYLIGCIDYICVYMFYISSFVVFVSNLLSWQEPIHSMVCHSFRRAYTELFQYILHERRKYLVQIKKPFPSNLIKSDTPYNQMHGKKTHQKNTDTKINKRQSEKRIFSHYSKQFWQKITG